MNPEIKYNTCGKSWGGWGLKEFFLFPIGILVISVIKSLLWDFPGGSVAKTPFSQYRGPGFDPWSNTGLDSTCRN